MISGTSRIGNDEMHGRRYLSGKIPVEIAENLEDFFPEHAGVSIEEVVAEQESAYHYIQTNGKKNDNSSTSSQTRNVNQSSRGSSLDSQLALDEALARSLELDDDFEGLCISDHHHTVAGRREPSPRETPSRVTNQNPRQYDIDPDNMTYEELQSLGDAVGHASKGLSEDLIRRLPTFKYKTGFFSKKKKEDCVICCSEYKSGVRLTTLPCAHQYHSACIERWLKLNKNCPICQVEVRDD